jgi:hypothetical protein
VRPNAKAPSPSQPIGDKEFNVTSGTHIDVQKIVEYGPGGVGKTKLASLIKEIGMRPLFIDLEDGSKFLDVERIEITNFPDLRSALHSEKLIAQYDAIVVDSLTKAEELARRHVVATVPHEKGHMVDDFSKYGFGKEWGHLYSAFELLLGDLDALARRGKQIICIAHDCVTSVKNPNGEDWIRYEPRLASPPNQANSIRHRVKEWADHLLFIGYDVAVSSDGKGKGGGTRTIYPTEYPGHWAKSRNLSDAIAYEDGSAEIWKQLFNKE